MRARFSVLGPVRVVGPSGPVPVPGPLRRGLLALLLLRAGHLVTLPEIVEALWGGAAPATAAAQVRAGISTLRRLIGTAGGADLLASRPAGYTLAPEPDALDLARFERAVRDARAAAADGDIGRSRDLLRSGLELWQAEPLADAAGAFVGAARMRLAEQRLAAEEELVEAELRSGRHGELVPALTALVAAHPLRQRPRGQLMLALYRSGRVPEALAVYQDLRRRLADEQGLDPDAELRQLHSALLRGDPELDVRVGPPAPVPQPPVPPRQLPRDIRDFTGRHELVDRVSTLLGGGGGGPSLVMSIVGKAGVGKTALAVHVAHRVLAQFPDGQLYASLGGEDRPADPADVLAGFLHALGVTGSALPAPLSERAACFRTLLAERRLLVVLDGAVDEAQVRPLLPGQPPSAVVITGRRRLLGLEGATVVELGLLRPDETADLLGRVAGGHRLASEPAAAAAVGERCGHLPLAVRICGARLAARPLLPLADMAALLADEHRRLGELTAGDLDVRSSFAVSYRALSDPQRRAFRLLGLIDAPDVAAWTLAALLGEPPPAADRLLQDLACAHLVDVVGRDAAGQVRYRLHDLLRLYATERLAEDEAGPVLAAAVRGGAAAAAAAVERETSHARAGRPPHWLAAERAVLVALVEQAFRLGHGEPTCRAAGWRLAAALEQFLEMGSHWGDWERTQRLALDAAVAAGDRRQEALARRRLAAVLWIVDRWPEALREAEHCLPVLRELGDRAEEARALRTLGRIQHDQGGWDRALASLAESREILERLGDSSELAATLRDIGMRQRFRDEPAAALDALRRALHLYESAGEPYEAACTRLQLAGAYRDLGELDAAVGELRHSLGDLRRFADPDSAAQALFQLAVTYRRQGDRQQAICCFEASLAAVRRLGQRLGEGMILLNLAEVHADERRYRQARRCADRSLAIFRELHSPYWQGRAQASLGRLFAETGRPASARRAWEQALRMLQPLGAPEAGAIEALVRQNADSGG